jgi:hypothetical protein
MLHAMQSLEHACHLLAPNTTKPACETTFWSWAAIQLDCGVTCVLGSYFEGAAIMVLFRSNNAWAFEASILECTLFSINLSIICNFSSRFVCYIPHSNVTMNFIFCHFYLFNTVDGTGIRFGYWYNTLFENWRGVVLIKVKWKLIYVNPSIRTLLYWVSYFKLKHIHYLVPKLGIGITLLHCKVCYTLSS